MLTACDQQQYSEAINENSVASANKTSPQSLHHWIILQRQSFAALDGSSTERHVIRKPLIVPPVKPLNSKHTIEQSAMTSLETNHILRRQSTACSSQQSLALRLDKKISTGTSCSVYSAAQSTEEKVMRVNPKALCKANSDPHHEVKSQMTFATRMVRQFSSEAQSAETKKESGPLSMIELELVLLSIIRQLLQTVSYLHSRQIVHRDIRLDTVEVF